MFSIAMSFNWLVYKQLNPDILYKTAEEYQEHYLLYGIQENRKHTIFDLYPDFNHQVYRNNYAPLASYNEFETEKHWLEIGSKHNLTYRNVLSDINDTSVMIVEYNDGEDELQKPNTSVLIILTNQYELNHMDESYYRSIIIPILEPFANIVSEEESNSYLEKNQVEYIVYLSIGDIITPAYIIENIKRMKDHDISLMKPNCFYYIGEHQVYHVTIGNCLVYLTSGMICKKGVERDDNEFIDNINHELFVKYAKEESQILNHPMYEIAVTNHPMAKRLCRENDANQIIRMIKGVPPKKGYITLLDKDRLDEDYMLRLQIHLTKLLVYDFEIIEYAKIETYNLLYYETILIDANLFNKKSTKISLEAMMKRLSPLASCKRNILLTHDLHDWSFGFADKPKKYEYINNVVYPCLSMTEQKNELKKMCGALNIRSMISIYDCPEFTFYKEQLKDTVFSYYHLHHFISTPIYHVPKVMNKDIDILFYGINDATYYLFRNRLLHLAQKRGPVTNIIRKFEFDPDICEEGLARYISRSWMTISCVSNFSYAVRKYNEISECGSVVIGNTNNQVDHILGDGMIRLHEDMTDEEILTIMNKYMKSKIKLVYLGFKARKNVPRFNDNNYLVNLQHIITDGMDMNYSKQLIEYKKLKKIINKRVRNGYLHFDSENSEIIIGINLKTIDYQVGCRVNVSYYRSVVINDIYYIYIEKVDHVIEVQLYGLDKITVAQLHLFQ